MQWHILAIGKPKLSYAKLGIEEYASRLGPLTSLRLDYIKAGTKQVESAALLERSDGMFRVVLDERGELLSSRAFATKVSNWENSGSIKNIALLVGGADGHTEELKQRSNWLWSLGPQTLQHELALVVVVEQLYRAYTIKGGMPYHRD
jgi:23S rRNA (pseudouridine1915-N3)-methyltransferase